MTTAVKEPRECSYAYVSQCMDEWLEFCVDAFTSNDFRNEYNINSFEGKDYLRQVQQDRVKKNILERLAAGKFRKRRNELTRLNWAEADPLNFWDIAWPLKLETWIKTYPGVYILAGAPNSGKTAYFNDFIMSNYHKHHINYFTSDMGEEEMKERFDLWQETHPGRYVPNPPKWDTWVRSGEFHDVIVPDAINIVDYLEIYQNFWEVGEQIKQIDLARGPKGVVLVGLQKNRGADLGRGGIFSLEKPKAYFSMDFQKFTIQKSRARAKSDTNPNGLVIDFKLHKGANFEELGYGFPE